MVCVCMGVCRTMGMEGGGHRRPGRTTNERILHGKKGQHTGIFFFILLCLAWKEAVAVVLFAWGFSRHGGTEEVDGRIDPWAVAELKAPRSRDGGHPVT